MYSGLQCFCESLGGLITNVHVLKIRLIKQQFLYEFELILVNDGYLVTAARKYTDKIMPEM